jgi:hypothetical protein
MERSKAFIINGGAGRVICSIPAFEKYETESGDDDFIIICEGGTEMFKGHPTLEDKTYDNWHKNLFKDFIKNRDIVYPEPYQQWEYYNQKANLSQSFDMIINNHREVRDLPKPTLNLSKDELLIGRKLITEVKEKLKKDKVVVLQPFGRGIDIIDDTLIDKTGRSIEFKDVKALIKKLQDEDFAVVLMAELKIDLQGEGLKDEVAMPEQISLRHWAAVIKYADHFLGCDSVGQHLAYAVETPSTVVIGSTYPENVSYPDCEYFNILDLGQNDRKYSPIRIVMDEAVDRHNENIMSMTPEIQDYVTGVVAGKVEHTED